YCHVREHGRCEQQTHTDRLTHTDILSHTHTRIYIYIGTSKNTHMHKHTSKGTHIHTNMCTHVCVPLRKQRDFCLTGNTQPPMNWLGCVKACWRSERDRER